MTGINSRQAWICSRILRSQASPPRSSSRSKQIWMPARSRPMAMRGALLCSSDPSGAARVAASLPHGGRGGNSGERLFFAKSIPSVETTFMGLEHPSHLTPGEQKLLSSEQVKAFYHDGFVEEQVRHFMSMLGAGNDPGEVVDVGG